MNIENDIVSELVNAMLILIPLGTAWRLSLCGISMMSGEEDEQPKNKKRVKNALFFMIIAESILAIGNHIYGYFK